MIQIPAHIQTRCKALLIKKAIPENGNFAFGDITTFDTTSTRNIYSAFTTFI